MTPGDVATLILSRTPRHTRYSYLQYSLRSELHLSEGMVLLLERLRRDVDCRSVELIYQGRWDISSGWVWSQLGHWHLFSDSLEVNSPRLPPRHFIPRRLVDVALSLA